MLDALAAQLYPIYPEFFVLPALPTKIISLSPATKLALYTSIPWLKVVWLKLLILKHGPPPVPALVII